ncbi:hypothetical protein OAN307_c15710 [Octadecabacter antarcticus 307]|uniref:Uncharacterized protein n=1 Tax=Octadecabacter antarcticus 307 TaxID=391626 RepID=M9R3M3_9RHOB|nr:hypothetical protein [Octadecabacter antarcticus]AGI67244.1 hypothetical protein OAN307_c15710 [Octadecabacter antarcticus 307]
MTYQTETIALKRLDKKLWQYKDCTPTRVELAVLDYLKELGWHGYFTEHFYYDQTLMCMMCWCNRDSYFAEKRKSLAIKNLGDVFYSAKDGFWGVDSHKLYHRELMENARRFTEESIPKILATWQKRGVKSNIVGRAYLKPRSAAELDAESLISFYRARGGLDYFISYLKAFFPDERQLLLYRAQQNFRAMKESHGDMMLSQEAGFFLDVFNSANPRTIEEWMSDIKNQPTCLTNSDNDLLELAQDIKEFRQQSSQRLHGWKTKANLDLTVWKDSVASIEVKAPRDRLLPHQKEQLELDIKNGNKSWVIEVAEL